MGALLRIYHRLTKIDSKSGLQWAATGGLLRNYSPTWPKLPSNSGLQWAAMGGILRNYPLLELTCKHELQWAEMGGLWGTTSPDWNSQVGVSCTGLQGDDFWEITPLFEYARKDWAAMDCNGSTFEELPPTDQNCHVRAGCNGLQQEEFWGITPPPPDKMPSKIGLH